MQKVLADEHVIGPLVEALRKRGLDVATVVQLGLKSEDDAVLLSRALAGHVPPLSVSRGPPVCGSREVPLALRPAADRLSILVRCSAEGET